MSYQCVITEDSTDRTWDSIRDTDRQALFQVGQYLLRESDSHAIAAARMINNRLIFGTVVCAIQSELEQMGFTCKFTYIP